MWLSKKTQTARDQSLPNFFSPWNPTVWQKCLKAVFTERPELIFSLVINRRCVNPHVWADVPRTRKALTVEQCANNFAVQIAFARCCIRFLSFMRDVNWVRHWVFFYRGYDGGQVCLFVFCSRKFTAQRQAQFCVFEEGGEKVNHDAHY